MIFTPLSLRDACVIDAEPHRDERGFFARLWCRQEFAHGFQCLRDESEVFYRISAFHAPDSGRGCRYDDPAFGIDWPLPVSVISGRDASWPDFKRDPGD